MSDTWTRPHISKIYEALGAIGDGRIEIDPAENEAKMYSSSRNKFYTVTWNHDLSQMMSNDNSAFFVGQLSYPMIAVLMLKGKITYHQDLPELLKGIKWKDINQKYKNDFDKTVNHVLTMLRENEKGAELVEAETQNIAAQISQMKVKHFGKRVRPPQGY